jgi:hypothetical protein
LYEFALEGKVSYSVFGVNPAVGEPCIIRFVADSQDVEPHPGHGTFQVTPPIVTFPDSNTLLNFEPSELTRLGVNNENMSGTGIDFLFYQNLGALGVAFDLNVSLVFPDGVIQSDALPLTLPLALANSTNFRISSGLVDYARGRITGYSSVAVPEPWGGVFCILALAATFRRNTKRRH